jgi:hypothetical protein
MMIFAAGGVMGEFSCFEQNSVGFLEENCVNFSGERFTDCR